MICVWCSRDLCTVEKLLGYGGQIVILGVRGGGEVHRGSIGVSIGSV